MNYKFLRQEEPTYHEAEEGAEMVFIYHDYEFDEEKRIYASCVHESYEQWGKGIPTELFALNGDRVENWRASINSSYEIDWNNVDLNSNYFRDQNILDPISFNDLLLVISTNISEINEETVYQEFSSLLALNISSATDIVKANLENLVNKAIKEKQERE